MWRNANTDPPPPDTLVLGLWTRTSDYALIKRTEADGVDDDGAWQEQAWVDQLGDNWEQPDWWMPLPPVPGREADQVGPC